MYDRIRAWARGTAPQSDARAFERELAAQRDLAQAAEEFREVHELTRPLHDEVPMSQLQFASLEERIDADDRAQSTQRIRRAAAVIGVSLAAAATLVAVFVIAKQSRGAGGEALRLTAIALDTSATSGNGGRDDELSAELPATLASYVPVRDGQVSWITDVEQARAIARAVDRPVLLFGMFETCPLCIQMKAEGLRDPEVLALFGDYVPLQVDLLNVDEEVRADYFARGYPVFEVHATTGEIMHSFPGFHDASELAENLQRGLTTTAAPEPALDWDSVHRAAQSLETARKAEADGRLGEAHREFRAVELETDHGVLAGAAQQGIARIAEDARAALLHARDLATRSADEAQRSLAEAAQRFEGSPYTNDLDAALASLRRTGHFPVLQGSGASSQ